MCQWRGKHCVCMCTYIRYTFISSIQLSLTMYSISLFIRKPRYTETNNIYPNSYNKNILEPRHEPGLSKANICALNWNLPVKPYSNEKRYGKQLTWKFYFSKC